MGYYLKVQRFAFFGTLAEAFKKVKEVPVFMCISMIVLAILSLVAGLLLIPDLKDLILVPAVKVVGGGITYAKMVLGG